MAWFSDDYMHHSASLSLHIEAVTEWPPFCTIHFQIHFLVWKLLYFGSNFTEIYSHNAPIGYIPLLVQIVAWHRTDKPLSETTRYVDGTPTSPRSISGTSAHPIMVTLVNIMVNGWLTSFSFHVNRRSHSWDKAISDSNLETPRSRSWMWSKGKVI